MKARTCFVVLVFCSLAFATGKAVALVNCVPGCNEARAWHTNIGGGTCQVFENGYAMMPSAQQVTTNLGGAPVSGLGTNHYWMCPSCDEVCNNNPLKVGREQSIPANLDYGTCTDFGQITDQDCSTSPP